jgi:tetratricopeptide (TPR) repeat protein
MKCPKCQTENSLESKFCRECATPLPSSEPGLSPNTKTFEFLLHPPANLAGGQVFAGRYQMVEELGRGGMGVVFRAYDNQLREEVALKIIKPEIATDKKAVERFNNELKLARRIIHRNVCRLYELMEHEGTRFISMEYVPGEDLGSFIHRARRLDLGAAVAIAIQVGEGLDEAHRLGVVHRDLKPGNILIDRDGNAKIMDFGIARSLLEARITGEGRLIGTPEYISPEQLNGEAATPQSDVYALGVILFEMVCGVFPFEGDTARVIALKLQGKLPPDPKTLNPHVPDDLAKVILKCLEKKLDRRYGRAGQVVDDLRRIEKDLPTTERVMVKARSSILTRITQRLKKRKALGAALALASAAAAVGLIFWATRQGEGPNIPPPGLAAAESKPVLAAFPFANKTNDSSLDVWGQNIWTIFIDALRQLAPTGLTVLSESTVREHLGKLGIKGDDYSSGDLDKIASLCGANHTLTGKFMKFENKLSLYYELGNVGGMASSQSGSRSGTFEDLSSTVAFLADDVVRKLGLAPPGRPREPKSRSLVAQQAYFEARDLEFKAHLSLDEKEKDRLLSRMAQKYRAAIDADGQYSDAYWGLGDFFESRFVDSHDPSDLKAMKENYQRAYDIDRTSAGANAGLGWARFFENRLDEAYSFFLEAARLEPHDPDINFNVGSFLNSIGQVEASIRYFTASIDNGNASVGPLGPRFRRAQSYLELDRLPEAEDDARSMNVMNSEDASLRLFYARILAKRDKRSEAERELARAKTLDPSRLDWPFVQTYLDVAAGEKARALPVLDMARNENPYKYSYFLAENYGRLGMAGDALDIIQAGVKDGFAKIYTHLFPYEVLKSAAYAPLRSEARFETILERQRERHFAQLEKYRDLCVKATER